MSEGSAIITACLIRHINCKRDSGGHLVEIDRCVRGFSGELNRRARAEVDNLNNCCFGEVVASKVINRHKSALQDTLTANCGNRSCLGLESDLVETEETLSEEESDRDASRVV